MGTVGVVQLERGAAVDAADVFGKRSDRLAKLRDGQSALGELLRRFDTGCISGVGRSVCAKAATASFASSATARRQFLLQLLEEIGGAAQVLQHLSNSRMPCFSVCWKRSSSGATLDDVVVVAQKVRDRRPDTG
jgi:hypothetical protein